jgi:hypothetical protein
MQYNPSIIRNVLFYTNSFLQLTLLELDRDTRRKYKKLYFFIRVVMEYEVEAHMILAR